MLPVKLIIFILTMQYRGTEEREEEEAIKKSLSPCVGQRNNGDPKAVDKPCKAFQLVPSDGWG